MNESVGYYLKRTREVREIELEDIAKKTKISVRFLKAIEEGKWHILPGDVFIKGFIRTYAQFLGLNPDEVVEKYIQEKGIEEKPIVGKIQKQPFPLNLILILGGVFFLLVLFLIFLIVLKNKGEKIEAELPESIPAEMVQEKLAEKLKVVKTNEVPKIQLLFTRHCWLKVEVDGKNVFEGFKEATDKLEYNFKESFVLKVGDAGALQLLKDGVPQPPLGDDGQPVLFKLP